MIEEIKLFIQKHTQKIFFGICLVFIANLVLLGVILFPSDKGKLVVQFFDIGQGDAIYLRLPSGVDVLIDGGPDKTILSKLGKAMPFYDREIDLVVLTHPHADHVTGLVDVLKNYKVKQVWLTGVLHTTDEYLEFLRLIKNQSIVTKSPARGEVVNLGKVKLEVLAPKESLTGKRVIDSSPGNSGGLNDTSIVLLAEYGESKFLFTGDVTSEIEKELLESGANLAADVLKVGHHGSKFSSSREFLRAVHPSYAVIQVGRGNHYGHPAFRTLRTLEQVSAEVFRNDLNGDVKIVSDGKELKTKVEKR